MAKQLYFTTKDTTLEAFIEAVSRPMASQENTLHLVFVWEEKPLDFTQEQLTDLFRAINKNVRHLVVRNLLLHKHKLEQLIPLLNELPRLDSLTLTGNGLQQMRINEFMSLVRTIRENGIANQLFMGDNLRGSRVMRINYARGDDFTNHFLSYIPDDSETLHLNLDLTGLLNRVEGRELKSLVARLPKHINHLYLSPLNGFLPAEMVNIFSEWPSHIYKLTLSGYQAGDISNLIETMKHIPSTVSTLRLVGNKLGKMDKTISETFVQAIPPSIRQLDLSHNQDKEDARTWLEVLLENTPLFLTKLLLRANHLSNIPLRTLASLLKKLPKELVVDLQGNHLFLHKKYSVIDDFLHQLGEHRERFNLEQNGDNAFGRAFAPLLSAQRTGVMPQLIVEKILTRLWQESPQHLLTSATAQIDKLLKKRQTQREKKQQDALTLLQAQATYAEDSAEKSLETLIHEYLQPNAEEWQERLNQWKRVHRPTPNLWAQSLLKLSRFFSSAPPATVIDEVLTLIDSDREKTIYQRP